MDNDKRYYLAELGANYRTVLRPTPKSALNLILSELATGSCMVAVERLGTGDIMQELIPGPGELSTDVTPVNDFVAYKHPGGDILYFSVDTGVSSCGEYQLLHMCCSECGEEILEAEDSGVAYQLEGLCPKCYFEQEFRREHSRRHADRLHALDDERKFIESVMPMAGDLTHKPVAPCPENES